MKLSSTAALLARASRSAVAGRRSLSTAAAAGGGGNDDDGSEGSNTRRAIEKEHRYAAHTYHPLPVVWKKASGVHVWDVDGKQYMDFLAAYSAVNQGHCHPRLVKALCEQASTLELSSRAFYSDRFGEFAEFATDFFGYERILPMNTGAEGAETAIKVARKWAYTRKHVPENEALIVAFRENFHGRTISIIAMSTDPTSYKNFGPYNPGYRIVPYNDLEAARRLFEEEGHRIAGVLVEPIQGEAGIRLPQEGFMQGLHALCKEHDALFIADEIQSGLGRAGSMLAIEQDNVRPDVIVLGKALSGGMYPVSAVLTSSEIMDVIQPGEHGSTYGGNPIGSVVAIEALKVLRDEKLVENSEAMGELFRSQLAPLADMEHVTEIRGRGLMNAIEVAQNGPRSAWELCLALGKRGILCKPTHDNIVRLTPPLCITREQMLEATEIIADVFSKPENIKDSDLLEDPVPGH